MPRTTAGADYFEKWYRDPAHRVSTPAATRRKAALALAVAEYYLGRPVRRVLDVGCGEGQWQPILTGLRPGLRYLGLDPSSYAVSRFGVRRNLRLGGFSSLDEAGLTGRYDLIVCSDLLYYLGEAELRRGLETLVRHLGGVAFLEAYDASEPLAGDIEGIQRLTAGAYRRLFRRAGLVPCGSHCYAGPELAYRVTDLERGG